MRILCVIDHFGSGGAQRQMVNLACGLKRNGHDVEFFTYFSGFDFFRGKLDKHDIPVHEFHKGRGFSIGVLWKLVSLLWGRDYDAAISFLSSPNVYLELAGIFCRRVVIVASERSSHYGDRSRFGALLRRFLHLLCDCVVVNSTSHATWLARYPWLRGKIFVVYNGYDIPIRPAPEVPVGNDGLSLIAIGRVGPEKNCLELIRALAIFYRRYGFCPRVSWVGRRDMTQEGVAYWGAIQNALAEYPHVWENWSWLGERRDVGALICEHRVLIHPSLYEGLPNVICESLIRGRAVLASNVCDNPMLVEDGIRGYLFDPRDPESIADAIHEFSVLGAAELRALGENSRNYGVQNLNVDLLVESYEKIIEGILSRRRAKTIRAD